MYIGADMRCIRRLSVRRLVRAALLVVGAAAALAGFSRADAQDLPAEVDAPESVPDTGPAAVMVTAGSGPGGVKVTLTFSRHVDYRLEEARSRLRILLAEPLAETSSFDRDLDGLVVRRIRVEPSTRGAQIVFNLGRDFDHFSSAELSDPFRLVLDFRGADSAPGQEGSVAGPDAADASGPDAAQERLREDERGSQARGGGAGVLTSAPPGAPVAVIDPGHGGQEAGAVGESGLEEKDLVLDVARRLRSRLSAAGFAVALTRDQDVAMDLTSRTALANSLGASLFVSLHANASFRASARGAETYFLASGVADEAAVGLARGEESRSEQGQPQGDDAAIDLVLWEMAQVEHLSRSSRLAELVQDELDALDSQEDRGVKQAPFRVLVGATMPAVLVEVGFLSNPEEEARLATESHRERIAELIASALARYGREEGIMAGARMVDPAEAQR